MAKNKKIADATISEDELEKEFEEALREVKEQGKAAVRVMKSITVALMTLMFFCVGLSLTLCGGSITVIAIIKAMQSDFQIAPLILYVMCAGIGCAFAGVGLEMLASTM